VDAKIIETFPPGPAASEVKPAGVRAILLTLCNETYDCSFQGVEWEDAIDKAIERLKPFLK